LKTITILNEKGGVGKTTITLNLMMGLAERGHRVLGIDADEQGHLTLSCGLEKRPALYNALVRDEPWRAVLSAVDPAKYGGQGKTRLYLIGSNLETRNIAHSISDAMKLANRLAELESRFDFCLIDTSPTPSLLHASIYYATDALIIPTELEYLSFDGLAETMRRAKAAAVINPGKHLEVLGIVPNKYRAVTVEHQTNYGKLKERFGDLVWRPIPLSIIWPEAAMFALPVFTHAPDHDAAAQVWEMVDRVEAAYGLAAKR
jgi:chromosome partitioning protein